MPDKKPPAFQFYAGDFLTDTMAMPNDAVGAYIRLLCFEWLNGSIPEDLSAIARVCGVGDEDMRSMWSFIESKFIKNPEQNGTRVNRRLEREREKQRLFRESRARAGRKSAEQRANKAASNAQHKSNINPTRAATNAQHKSNSSSSSSSSSSREDTSPAGSSNRHPFGEGAQLDLDAVPNDEPAQSKQPITPPCPYAKIVEIYHETLPTLPLVKILSDKRKTYLRTRWREDPRRQKLDWWRKYFEYIRDVPFLMGKNDRSWTVGFDFVITQSKMIKIIEGDYEH